ncbi:uncharacterized protein LOC127857542 [Dreissena polymorpha]|uniref:uncharacterized protein LOC127857542 n=1 Tax=Dreissena polymorpha TaxID=45954 RepID=UPI002264DC3C|nr:uncharacterized protein LOC127857542 [Dreissena polymorpha]
MAARKVTLLLTPEQEETIKALFNHNDWEYIEIKSTKVCRKRKAQHVSEATRSVQQPTDSTGNSGPGGYGDNGGDGEPGGDGGDGGPGAVQAHGKCLKCYMNPCVVIANRHLCGQGQGPSEYNPPIRKDVYKKFWRVIDNLGGWLIKEYRRKKSNSSNLQNIVYLKRDIMPECVLDFVRARYPNPHGQAYMGHKWE